MHMCTPYVCRVRAVTHSCKVHRLLLKHTLLYLQQHMEYCINVLQMADAYVNTSLDASKKKTVNSKQTMIKGKSASEKVS